MSDGESKIPGGFSVEELGLDNKPSEDDHDGCEDSETFTPPNKTKAGEDFGVSKAK